MNPEAGTEVETVEEPKSLGPSTLIHMLNFLLYTTHGHLPNDYMANNRLGPPTSISNEINSPKHTVTGQYDRAIFLNEITISFHVRLDFCQADNGRDTIYPGMYNQWAVT